MSVKYQLENLHKEKNVITELLKQNKEHQKMCKSSIIDVSLMQTKLNLESQLRIVNILICLIEEGFIKENN
jgi:hypothetical protein